MKKRTTFTLDEEVVEALARTKNGRSASEWANDLLRRALKAERDAHLAREAEAFFRGPETADEKAERRAFHDASIRSMSRD